MKMSPLQKYRRMARGLEAKGEHKTLWVNPRTYRAILKESLGVVPVDLPAQIRFYGALTLSCDEKAR